MSVKKNVLKNYIGDEKMIYVISHHFRKYKNTILFYTILLLSLFLLYEWLTTFIHTNHHKYVNLIFMILWIIFYLKFVIDYLDIFLDSLVLTDRWITIFRWDWFFQRKSEYIWRNYIQTVYDEQKWIFDVILNKWDLNIKIHEWEYKFEEVTNPSQKSNIISQTKAKINSLEEDDNEEDIDKFDVLVETLSEVIRDYMKRSKNKDEAEENEYENDEYQ